MNVYKQKLNIKDQVKYLEDKGISFNLFSKSNAEDYLTNNNYYYKLTSFRKNFRKHPDGPNTNKYSNLDFAYLVDLAIIDNYLRSIILEIALDIEHYSKLKLLHCLENNKSEDGYSIVKDFMVNQGQNRQVIEKRIIESEWKEEKNEVLETESFRKENSKSIRKQSRKRNKRKSVQSCRNYFFKQYFT